MSQIQTRFIVWIEAKPEYNYHQQIKVGNYLSSFFVSLFANHLAPLSLQYTVTRV